MKIATHTLFMATNWSMVEMNRGLVPTHIWLLVEISFLRVAFARSMQPCLWGCLDRPCTMALSPSLAQFTSRLLSVSFLNSEPLSDCHILGTPMYPKACSLKLKINFNASQKNC